MSVEFCLQDGELLSDILPIFFLPILPYFYAFLFLRLTWVPVMRATVSVGKPHQPLPGYLLQLLQGVAGLDGGWNPSSVWVWVRTPFSWTCLERFPKDSSESFAFELNFFLTEEQSILITIETLLIHLQWFFGENTSEEIQFDLLVGLLK